ncbi:MAG: translation elongation factor Ts [Fimbriimonadaceae bacterium]|nr:translation elongation factor Ts [Fimbriimonadaceae bacterium]QYK59670.1 MAG: translation elongation factor Ts [Fimbriimonadaceae bacterium]
MPTISATDVKKLREETDAPMMECKAALEEADGDMARAKDILREKGKAAAAKRADRATSEGIARFLTSEDGKTAVGLVVECETDFVAKNDSFKQLVDKLAHGMLAAGAAGEDVKIDGKAVAEHVQDAVAVIRENIQLKQAVFVKAAEGALVAYNHHDGKKASVVEAAGPASNLKDAAYHVAVQTIGFAPVYLVKEEVPQDVIAHEIKIEMERAINEGKDAAIAEKAAQGRVNKEFYQSRVLMEQPIYIDQKKSVRQYLEEEGKVGGGPITIKQFVRLFVGME